MLIYNDYSDKELSDLLRSGDHAAFTEIYSRYWPVLYLHARRMLDDKEKARDTVQEVFISIWNRSAKFDQAQNLKAFLYKMVRNAVLNMIRHERVKADYLTDLGRYFQEASGSTDELLLYNDLSRIIEREVASMPERMRSVFQLSRKHQYSHAEIAEKLNISEATVKKQINKALRLLRLKLHLPFSVIFLLMKL